uniref:RING-type domain-containing protein n=1 Tax=Photinus pyralis TaxID=7054 RepID=A0A1Y1LPB4_PHOPY
MDNLIEETRKLSNTLNIWEFGSILQLFTKHEDKEPIERRYLVLGDYFGSIPSQDSATCQREADIIKEIFPQIDRGYIVKLLEIIGNEENRIRIIIKLLLRRVNKIRKRANNDMDSVSQSPTKKVKLNDELDVSYSTAGEPSTSKVQTTLPRHNVLDINQPSTSKAPEVPLLCDWLGTNQPSTSKSRENSTVVKIDDAKLPEISVVDEVSHLFQLPTATNRDKVAEWLDIVDAPPAVESSQPKEDVTPFHLYKHIQEMFSNISIKYIRTLCKRLNLSKHERPPEQVMDFIISTLVNNTLYDGDEDEEDEDEEVEITNVTTQEPTKSKNTLNENDIPKIRLRRTTNGFIQNVARLPTVEEIVEESRNAIFPDDVEMTENGLESILDQLREEQNADEPHALPEEEQLDNKLVHPLMEIFPDACPQFIRKICKGKRHSPAVMDNLIAKILDTDMDYPKRQKVESPPCRLNASEQLELMKSILVDADPDYLQMHCDRLIDNPDELKAFVSEALETRDYPTLKEYLRKKQISAQQNQYTNKFSVAKFLEVIPDPFQYFADSKRKVNGLDNHSHHYAMCYLRNKFALVSVRSIRESFIKNEERFLATCKELESYPSFKRLKSKRPKVVMPSVIQNIPLLQEIAFYDHQEEITEFLNKRKIEEEMERKQAKAAGLLQTCACCYDDEIMFKDITSCEAGCIFCKDCVRKGAEVAFGDGKLDFPCLGDCESHFSLQVLQAVLTPKMFSVVALKKQVEEVKAAGIDDLETCPFCDFVTIPARDDKLFRCLNPECMKESCRMCKEPSHVPLRCDEVEKDADVKARTYIENKMTEALLRTCYKCGMKFIKSDGCNKMTCSCGALMCYVCNQPVKDYNHFNGPGGDKTNLCPLYSDTNQLHKDAILKSAEEAKNDIGISVAKKLKIDPTADIQHHYKTNTKPVIPAAPVNPFLGLNREDLLLQERALQMFEHYNRRLHHRRGHH